MLVMIHQNDAERFTLLGQIETRYTLNGGSKFLYNTNIRAVFSRLVTHGNI